MLLAVLSELGADPAGSWMVGDTDADVLAGRSAGLSTVLIENPASGHKRGRSRPMSTAGGLPEAVDIILGESPCR